MNDELNRRAPAQPEPAAPDPANSYARGLAVALHASHYPQVTQWRPLDDTLGLLTQIDNMTCSLVRPEAAPTVVEPEPVGKRMTVEELARTDGRFPFVWWREVPPGSLLYLAAPPRTPLTDAEIRKIAVEQASSSFGPADNDDETIDWIFNREDLLIFARAVIAASEGERK